ncbi:MAG: ABC transporter ATP-binding protein [Hyphomonadaceae bacterium]|nr:ABC transporter ATP-binding protein [Hyphomonadaceae bacterium]
MVAAIVLATAASGLAGLAPLALKQLIDQGLESFPVSATTLYLGGLYVGAMVAGRLAGCLQGYLYATGDQALQTRVSVEVLRELLCLPMRFQLHAPPGALVQTQNHALQGVRLLLSLACLSILPVFAQMVVILTVVAGLFDASIWTVVAAAIAAYGFVFTLGVRRTAAPAEQALASQIASASIFSDAILHAETVKGFSAEGRILARYRERLAAGERSWRACYVRRAETALLASVVFGVVMSAALLLGAAGVRSGQITIGEFVLLNAYLLQIVGPLEATGFAFRDAAQSLAYLKDWNRMLQVTPEQTQNTTGPTACTTCDREAGVQIRFCNVSFAYDAGRPVINDVTFEAPPGGLTAIVGLSGAGKSSVLRLLQRHYEPTAGQILLDGTPLSHIDLHALRRRMAVVTQDVMLSNDTLRENLLIARPDADDIALHRALLAVGLAPLVVRLPKGLETLVGERGLSLSGGERQRVAVARALLRDAEILILDEATSALDGDTERAVWAELIRATKGRTTLIVTHDLSVAALAANIVVLNDGRVEEQGAHGDLIDTDGLYARLWRCRSAGGTSCISDAAFGTH